jgi:hypothetical protein
MGGFEKEKKKKREEKNLKDKYIKLTHFKV